MSNWISDKIVGSTEPNERPTLITSSAQAGLVPYYGLQNKIQMC